MLGTGGFDADRDIATITVNRWGHAYSYMGDPCSDPVSASPKPFEVTCARVGRVAIANSDAAWVPFVHVAIDQGHRAAGELLDRS